jgi:hypothetical protein
MDTEQSTPVGPDERAQNLALQADGLIQPENDSEPQINATLR